MTVGSARAGSRPVLLGRRGELAELREGLADARSGRGQLFLIAGEGGIGKTRLVEALIEEAEHTEVRARWGRCWEGGGASPFWPWVQVLQSCVADTPSDALVRQLGPGAPDIAQLVPEVVEKLPGLVAEAPSTSPDSRLRLFDSVAGFLRNAASDGGLLVALDDLHAADEASLRLLQHVADQSTAANLFIVGTYRDAEVRSAPQLHRLMAAIGRQGRRLVLTGLDQHDVTALLKDATGGDLDPGFARDVHYTTDGNPFLVQEVVRLRQAGAGAGNVPLPEEVYALIRRRLASVPEMVREVITLGAVAGREFDLAVLQATGDMGSEALLDLLGEAARLSVVEETGLGRWTFVHGLLREALYEEIRPSHRVTLHSRIGDALERVRADDLGPHVAELAHHYFEAARGGDGTKAWHYCRLAGDAALATLAFEAAAMQYGRALEALALTPPVDEEARYDLLMALGTAVRRRHDFPQAREIHRRALKSARALGSAERLARAAVSFYAEPESVVDETRASVLGEALAALPNEDSPLRARVLIALGASADFRTQDGLPNQGLEMARRCGDAETLRVALWEWHWLAHDPELLEKRLDVADEIIRLSAAAGDRERLQQGRQWRAYDLLAMGRVEDARTEIEAACTEAEELRLPFLVWGSTFQRGCIALLRGRLGEADTLIHAALAAGERSEFTDVEGVHIHQLYALRREQGRHHEMVDLERRALDKFPAYAPLVRAQLAVALAETARTEEARREIERCVDDLPNLWGFGRVMGPALIADACWLVGESRWADRLYDALAPWPERHIVVGFSNYSLGASDRYLGQLATLVDRFDDAERHFEAAHRLHERLGAPGWLAHGRADHARMLLRREGPGDPARARELLTAARETYAGLGMAVHEERVRTLLGGSSAPSAGGRPETGTFALEGEYWAIDYGGAQARLRDSKGLRYLVRLLQNPGQEVHALDLVVGERGAPSTVSAGAARESGLLAAAGDAGSVLDAKAKAAYKRRLEDLEEEIDEASMHHDVGRLERAQREKDFLIAELSAAVGLGGRDRKAASDAEKARQSVTRAIKGSIERIGEAHPALGEHLRTTVRTGVYSSYVPDPRAPIRWEC